jgi:hypothetical protein
MRVAEALDRCVARLARGESVSQCLYDYPQYTAELRSLLETAIALRRLPQPKQRPEAVKIGYGQMMAASRAELRRRSRSVVGDRAVSRRPAASWWLGAAAAFSLLLLLAVGGALLLQSGVFLRTVPLSAEIVVAEAEGVVLRLPSGTRSWVPAEVGDKLAVGDRLQTSVDGRAALLLAGSFGVNLLSSAEIAVLTLPSLRQDMEPLVIYQEEGSVIYDVAMNGDEVSSSELGSQVLAPLEVHTLVAATRASSAKFAMAVAADGATVVSVNDGEVDVVAGEWVRLTRAGEVTVVGPGGEAEPVTYGKGELPPGWGWGLGLGENRVVPLGPPGDGAGPPGLEDKDKERDPQPPGLEDKDGVPPGQVDKDDDHRPPGLEDKGGLPPGLEDKDKDR